MLVCPLCRLTLGENETTCPRDGREGAEASVVAVPDAIKERFTIVEPYGRGDSGDLFLADDKKSGRRGVLKLVRLPEQTTPAEKARLKRELVKQATLTHGVLTVPLATGEADGHPWVFRDWHEGVSLAVRLERGGALAVPEALTIAAQAASALDELHRAGLLHRDLKPGHIIVEPQPSGQPRVHIIDAGLPARLETGAVFDVMGTAAYLSPEQAKGKLVSFRSDLYALGCVLFEMLSGSPPFEGDVEALLAAHAKDSAPTLKVEMPGAVATLLSRLLSKEPRERPFSAQQVRRALEPFLPEDPSGREATQAFDEGADAKRRVPSPKTSGTLPPPSRGKASVPPPPPSAATKPKGASVPPPPKKGPARPVRQTSKTLMGMPLSADAAPAPNRTEELSALDLEQAEEVLKTPKLSNAALGGGLGGLDAAVAAAPAKGASIPAAPVSQPPAASAPTASPAASASASSEAAPPWDSKEIRPTEPPTSATADPAPVPTAAEPAVSDGDSDDDGDLDYDDLAETVMFDREGEEGMLPPVEGSTPPPGNPDPYATPVPEPVAAAAEPTAKKSKPWGLIVLGLLAGGCLLFTGIAGGVGYWFYGKSQEAVAELDRELQNPNFGNVEPSTPGFPTGTPPPRFNPAPPPVQVQPTPPPLVQPTPPPLVEEPVVEEPVVEEPVVEEPVVEEPVRAEPTRPERPTAEPRPRPPEGGNRQARFEAARQRALAAYRAGRFPQAAEAYEEATQINSRHAGSFAGLGACRMRMGQHARAIRAYQRAIQLSPRHAGFYGALGSAYHASGDRTRARQAYQRALALDPNNAGARQGLSRL